MVVTKICWAPIVIGAVSKSQMVWPFVALIAATCPNDVLMYSTLPIFSGVDLKPQGVFWGQLLPTHCLVIATARPQISHVARVNLFERSVLR